MISQVTYATLLTLIRFLLVPFIMYGIVQGFWTIVIILMLTAGLTDLFDGFVARYFAQETILGALLDPVADKLLLLGSYSAFWYGYGKNAGIPWFFCLIAFLRESCILIGAGCLLWYRYAGVSRSLAPTTWGKRTTAMQIVFLLLLCISMLVSSVRLVRTTECVMVLVMVGMGISLAQYMYRGLEE